MPEWAGLQAGPTAVHRCRSSLPSPVPSVAFGPGLPGLRVVFLADARARLCIKPSMRQQVYAIRVPRLSDLSIPGRMCCPVTSSTKFVSPENDSGGGVRLPKRRAHRNHRIRVGLRLTRSVPVCQGVAITSLAACSLTSARQELDHHA